MPSSVLPQHTYPHIYRSPPQHQSSFLPGCLLPDHKMALLILTPHRSLCLCSANLSSGKQPRPLLSSRNGCCFCKQAFGPLTTQHFPNIFPFFCGLNCLPLERRPHTLSFFSCTYSPSSFTACHARMHSFNKCL